MTKKTDNKKSPIFTFDVFKSVVTLIICSIFELIWFPFLYDMLGDTLGLKDVNDKPTIFFIIITTIGDIHAKCLN